MRSPTRSSTPAATSYDGLGEFNAAVPGWTGNNTGGVDTTNVPPPRQTRNAWEASGQLGGPLRQNRLWFFGGFADKGQAFRAFGFSGPGYTEEHAPQWIFKLDAALTNSVRLQGFYDGDRSTTIGDGLWEFAPTLEAAGDAHDRNHAWNVSATWTPDSRTLLEVRSGGKRASRGWTLARRATGTGSASCHIDVITGVTDKATSGWWATGATVATASASAQRFIEAAGSHVLKAGVEVDCAATNEDDGFPAGEQSPTWTVSPCRS